MTAEEVQRDALQWVRVDVEHPKLAISSKYKRLASGSADGVMQMAVLASVLYPFGISRCLMNGQWVD